MLHRPWVAPLVVGFWCVTVGWLLATKILPVFEAGAPPDASLSISAANRLVPVGWTVSWNGTPIGWALTQAHRAAEGGLTVDSRLHCERLPLDEILPVWAGSIVQRSLRPGAATGLDATGHVVIDPAGRLRSFASTVTLPGTEDKVVLEGRATEPGEVAISFRAGEFRYDTTRQIPDRAMVGDELSPQATLPGLYEGRRWTVPVYNPLRPGTASLQILHARVGGEETIFWGNRLVNARVVTYREEPSSHREPRCRLWVDRAGKVLRHESTLLGARMEFVRRTDAEAARLATVAAVADQPTAEPAAEPPPETVP
jgi:hypothetical protein